jgi:hypothetical protein
LLHQKANSTSSCNLAVIGIRGIFQARLRLISEAQVMDNYRTRYSKYTHRNLQLSNRAPLEISLSLSKKLATSISPLVSFTWRSKLSKKNARTPFEVTHAQMQNDLLVRGERKNAHTTVEISPCLVCVCFARAPTFAS